MRRDFCENRVSRFYVTPEQTNEQTDRRMDGQRFNFIYIVDRFACGTSCVCVRAYVCTGEILLLAGFDLMQARLSFHQTTFHATGLACELRCVRAC